MVIEERLERRFAPAIEDPILDTAIVLVGLVTSCSNRVNNLSLPIFFDEVFEVFSVCGSRVGDIVVGEPTLKFGLMPFVVGCLSKPSAGYSDLGRSKCHDEEFGERELHG